MNDFIVVKTFENHYILSLFYDFVNWEILVFGIISRVQLLTDLSSARASVQTLDTKVIESDWLLLHLIQEITITDWLIGSEMSSWLDGLQRVNCLLNNASVSRIRELHIGQCLYYDSGDVQIDWFYWFLLSHAMEY